MLVFSHGARRFAIRLGSSDRVCRPVSAVGVFPGRPGLSLARIADLPASFGRASAPADIDFSRSDMVSCGGPPAHAFLSDGPAFFPAAGSANFIPLSIDDAEELPNDPVGQFLKENWRSIAVVVGAGGLVAVLLKASGASSFAEAMSASRAAAENFVRVASKALKGISCLVRARFDTMGGERQ